jgi:hypothetical protein
MPDSPGWPLEHSASMKRTAEEGCIPWNFRANAKERKRRSEDEGAGSYLQMMSKQNNKSFWEFRGKAGKGANQLLQAIVIFLSIYCKLAIVMFLSMEGWR